MTVQQKFKHLVLPILLLLPATQLVFATTVLHVDLDYLLDKAGLIFEGEVVASEARWNSDRTTITTFITFRVDEVIKGETQGSSLTLEFSGGTVGETGLHVDALVYPRVGENGIYFMENPGIRLINPLLGWGQGHFRVKQDNQGMQRVFTENEAPVMSLDFTGMSGTGSAMSGRPASLPFSHGVARGVRAGLRNEPMTRAMDKIQFKNALKARLQTIKSRLESTPGAAGGHHGR